MPMAQKLLGFQIIFDEKRRVEKLCDADTESLANFVDDSELYGIIGAVYQIADGGFWYSAFDI